MTGARKGIKLVTGDIKMKNGKRELGVGITEVSSCCVAAANPDFFGLKIRHYKTSHSSIT